jgi:hypothetical protein
MGAVRDKGWVLRVFCQLMWSKPIGSEGERVALAELRAFMLHLRELLAVI